MDLLSKSWLSVAWYPIYRIPTGPTLRDLAACFLTFHPLSTPFQDGGNINFASLLYITLSQDASHIVSVLYTLFLFSDTVQVFRFAIVFFFQVSGILLMSLHTLLRDSFVFLVPQTFL